MGPDPGGVLSVTPRLGKGLGSYRDESPPEIGPISHRLEVGPRWVWYGGGFGIVVLAVVVGFFVFGGSDEPDTGAVVRPTAAAVEDEPASAGAIAVPDPAVAVEDEPALVVDDGLASANGSPATAPPDYTPDEVMFDLFMQGSLGISLFDEDVVPFLSDSTLPDIFVLTGVDPPLRTSFFEDEIDEDFGDLGPVPSFSGFGGWWLPLSEPVENPQVEIFDLYAPMADIAFPPGTLNTPAQNVLAVAVEIAADLTDPAVCAGKELVLVLNIYNPGWGDPYVANPRFAGEYYAGGNFFPNFNLSDCAPTSSADTFLDGEIIAGLATSGVALLTVRDGVTRWVVLLSEETVNADASVRAILFEHPVGETYFPENTRYQSTPDTFEPAAPINDSISLYDFTLVPITTEPVPTTTTTTSASTETVDPGALVEAFVAEFAAATASDDVEFLVARLHPLVIQESDQQTCAAFVAREITGLEQYRATGPAQQTALQLTVDGQVFTVEPAFEVPVAFTFSGQEFTDNARFAPVDGVMHYFATCR